MVGSRRRRCEGLQQESRQPQHADDAKQRGQERKPTKSEDAIGQHQEDRQPATSARRGGQGQGRHQEEVREGIYARLERRGLHRPERIERKKDNAHITDVSYEPIIERQAMYSLEDPNNTLTDSKNGMYTRNELLLVQKAN